MSRTMRTRGIGGAVIGLAMLAMGAVAAAGGGGLLSDGPPGDSRRIVVPGSGHVLSLWEAA